MKKFLSFAIAIIACALTFTSCDPNIDSPIVGNWNTRGYLVETDPTDGISREYEVSLSLSFFDNGQYQYNIYYYGTFNGYVKRGTWSVKDDKLTIRTQKSGKIRNNEFIYDNFTTTEEVVTWRIEGHYLHLTYSDGHEESYYDGSGPNY